MTLTLQSTAFKQEELIPRIYTCDGEDFSPELSWAGVPEGTQSLVLIMDDPDAPMGTWDHWILFNLPADISMLAENFAELPAGTKEGKNSWGRTGYGGPCPPDKIHRYFFKLYALDQTLGLDDSVSKSAIEDAMQGHILGEAVLMGKYDRKR